MGMETKLLSNDEVFDKVTNILKEYDQSSTPEAIDIQSHIRNLRSKCSKLPVQLKVELVREMVTNNNILEENVVPTLTNTGYIAHCLHDIGSVICTKVYFENQDLTWNIEGELRKNGIKPSAVDKYYWLHTSYGFIAYTREKAFVIYLNFNVGKIQKNDLENSSVKSEYSDSSDEVESKKICPLASNEVDISPIDINLKYSQYIISRVIECLSTKELKIIIILTKNVLKSEESLDNEQDSKLEKHHMLIVWKIEGS